LQTIDKLNTGWFKVKNNWLLLYVHQMWMYLRRCNTAAAPAVYWLQFLWAFRVYMLHCLQLLMLAI